MSDDSNLDASSFNLDAWIDGQVRPEITVELYPHDVEFGLRLKAIQDQVPAAEKTRPEDRGLDDPSVEQLFAQIQELKAERTAKALRVRVRQLLDDEIVEAARLASEAKASERDAPLYIVAAACVEPAFTVEQLKRLRGRDRSGEGMVGQLIRALTTLNAGLPVPS